ncbi:hypothetical protein BC938DRAFT_471082 [Jimgerdemannia flammicorona]|uniref:Uncharacterized protein n=1 Tax=Jimgerdemannia flammicorona TaxID=994334 RepID=A0A433Q8W8_9FUNG|nr:hypothetical protein BC938DRAFT_471082 [Jimgerdemannia flammicorona]
MPQFGMPPMPMQQGAPMQYMNPAVSFDMIRWSYASAFAQAGFQQFVPNMSFTTAPMPHAPAPPAVYSPQIQPQVAPPREFIDPSQRSSMLKILFMVFAH